MGIQFKKAERKQAKLKIGICGPAGSGKTYSALLLAKGLTGKIAVLDTENGSAELYSHLADYDVVTLAAPYEPARYIEIIDAAVKAGYATLIIDSLSPAWAGSGGILEIQDKKTAATPSKNSFAGWRFVTPLHNALIDKILNSNINIIATLRAKTVYEVVEVNGRKTPQKIGLAPIQREGMDYEFTVVFDVAIDNHLATVSKDRTDLFDGFTDKITEATGRKILEWLESGAAPEELPEPPPASTEYADGAAALESADSLDDLAAIWQGLTGSQRRLLGQVKDAMKERLSDSVTI